MVNFNLLTSNFLVVNKKEKKKVKAKVLEFISWELPAVVE